MFDVRFHYSSNASLFGFYFFRRSSSLSLSLSSTLDFFIAICTLSRFFFVVRFDVSLVSIDTLYRPDYLQAMK